MTRPRLQLHLSTLLLVSLLVAGLWMGVLKIFDDLDAVLFTFVVCYAAFSVIFVACIQEHVAADMKNFKGRHEKRLY